MTRRVPPKPSGRIWPLYERQGGVVTHIDSESRCGHIVYSSYETGYAHAHLIFFGEDMFGEGAFARLTLGQTVTFDFDPVQGLAMGVCNIGDPISEQALLDYQLTMGR